MSRVRIALAATSVVAGLTGAALVLEFADDGDSSSGGSGGGATRTAAHTQAPARIPPVSVSHRSRCLVDRGEGVIRFRITLRNSAAQSSAALVHPWVGFSNGGEIQETSWDQQLAVPPTGTREVEIVVPYEPRIYTPNRCRVYLDSARHTAIVVRRMT